MDLTITLCPAEKKKVNITPSSMENDKYLFIHFLLFLRIS